MQDITSLAVADWFPNDTCHHCEALRCILLGGTFARDVSPLLPRLSVSIVPHDRIWLVAGVPRLQYGILRVRRFPRTPRL